MITQQTPKALAQFPSAVPELEHSVEVIQTPFKPVVETAEHSLNVKTIRINSNPKYFEWNSNTGLRPTVETDLHSLKYIKGIIGLYHSNMPSYHTIFLFLLVFEGNNAE